eukprot:TRINITY_DN14065_c0_g2_i1.p1 TRINITY_DN14065_c0_g2~~TRINITY_DN14065_c0_g2_i1.p1  ORF type:complete len:222 (+),score=45.69 TRINITY_DN14065_c0_g2_i1:78-743(+)
MSCPMDDVIALFHRWDVNKSGLLSYDELHGLLEYLGTPPAEIPRIFHHIDENKDGNVDWEEFVKWVFSETTPVQEAMLGTTAVAKHLLKRVWDSLQRHGVTAAKLFQGADVKRAGYLSRDDIHNILIRFDTSLTASLLDEAFRLYDLDNNGWIDVNEFVRTLEAEGRKPPPSEEIPVTVPYSWRPGQQVSVEHRGMTYYLDVPIGTRAGEVFTASVEIPLP